MAHGDGDGSAFALETSEDPSAITKYLCAAAYLDAQFASTVVSQVLEERHRFVAPSYGVDVPTVVRHCLDARRREVILQSVLATLLLLAWLPYSPRKIVFFFLLAWAAVFGETLYRRHVIVARRIAKGDSDPGITDGQHKHRLDQLATDQREGNITVYGGFSPFVGSGTPVDGWSFVLDLTRRTDNGNASHTAHAVDVVELHDFVAAGLHRLQVPGLRVEDRLFVNGQEIRDDRRFLPDPDSRPLTRVDPDLVRSFVGRQTSSARGYLCARVVDWRGELVVSVYLRFLSVSGNLFAEANYYVLPGLKHRYHSADAITAEPTVRQVTRLLRESLRKTPLATLKAPLGVGAWLLTPWQRRSSDSATRRAIRENPSFDYGARASIRELAMSGDFRRYFQRVDKEMYTKLLEHRILDLVVQFLDDRNVDTGELRERRNVIVNNGVMLSGGTFQADSVAVGKNATSSVRRVERVRQAASGASGD
jgi:hypothetical protein